MKITSSIFLLLLGQIAFAQSNSSIICDNEECLESIHFDSVRLNHNIPIKLKDSELFKLLGEPDSVITEKDWECGNYLDESNTVKIYYFGKSRFISSKGISLLHVLSLSDNKFTFDFGNNHIKSGITKKDLCRIFPNAIQALNEQREEYNKQGTMRCECWNHLSIVNQKVGSLPLMVMRW